VLGKRGRGLSELGLDALTFSGYCSWTVLPCDWGVVPPPPVAI